MFSQRHLFFAFLITFALEGCIPVPVRVAEEVPNLEAATELEPGITTRESVLTQFGKPTAIHAQDSTLVYMATERHCETEIGQQLEKAKTDQATNSDHPRV